MRVVGLTGGIGSGKSTVSALLADRGALVIDADVVAREVVSPGGRAHDAVLARFGTLDRRRLAELVFEDPAALAELNAIVHPAVRAVVEERLAELRETAADDALVVLVVPLLIEASSPYATDLVMVVDCPEELALERLVRRRGLDESDARRRMAAQTNRARRLEAADLVILNDGSLDDLRTQVAEAWTRLTA